MANKQRWMNGQANFVMVPVASAVAIEIGDQLKIASNLGVPVSAATDNLTLHAVADQAHAAGDGDITIRCLKIDPNSIYEYDLNTATDIVYGDELQINAAQKLKKSATDPVANAVETKAGATKIRCTFKVPAPDQGDIA